MGVGKAQAYKLERCTEDRLQSSASGRGPTRQSANSMGQGTGKPVGDRVSQPAGADGMSTGYEHIARYGDEAAWTNVVWTIIGILSACGLAVLLFMQWATTKLS